MEQAVSGQKINCQGRNHQEDYVYQFKNKLKWTKGETTSTGGNNVNNSVPTIKLGVGSIVIVPKRLTARVGSDGTNKVDRGAKDFQDVFDVNLKKGGNVCW